MAIDRRTTIYVLLVIILVSGIYSWMTLPRESNPEVVVPFIHIAVTYEGVTPEDMESLVTLPLERKLANLKNIKQITSTSVEGVSSVFLEFDADSDVDDSLQRVRDKVDQARNDLPADAEDPVITELNISEFPIMILSLTGELPLPILTEIAEDIEDRIETIKGVLDVKVIGQYEREIQIVVDPVRVVEYGVSMSDLISITRLENVNTPGGSLDLGEGKYLMRTPGEIRSPEELNNLVVKQGAQGTVYLRDIAEVVDGYKETTSISRVNGKPSLTLTISKRAGENIVAVAEQIQDEIERTNASLPAGIALAVTLDESDFVRDMVADLENSILSGLILVCIVIFLFLGLTNAFLVALAIPISMLMTFTIIQMSGITLNMVVLFSLTLALGMLVDNGIVVVENIYRHYALVNDPVKAAKDGAGEVAWPIIGSTITTVMAFLPMFFWPGIFGEFMFYLPFTVSVALFSSLFVGLIVNPALMAVTLGKPAKPEKARKRNFVLQGYQGLLRLALRWRAVTVSAAIATLVLIVVTYSLDAKVEFTPQVEPWQAFINITAPEGTNLATSDGLVRQVERILEPYSEDIEHVIANVGAQGNQQMGAFGGGGGNATHASQITLDFPKLRDAKVMPSHVLEQIRDKFDTITGAEVQVEVAEMGPPTGPPVNVEISGDEFDTLSDIADKTKDKIRHIDGLVDVRDDYNKGKPEVKVVVDREQAWKTGLNTQFIGLTVQAAIDGRKAGDYRENDEEYDVIVRFPKKFSEDLKNIETMNLVNLQGQAIPFSAVAHIEQGAGLGSIKRIDRKRTVTVSGEVTGERRPPEVLADVRAALADFPLPQGYSFSYTGANQDQEETEAFLGPAFAVALLLVTLVLVTQFNSVLQPLVIMTAVILSIGGVFLGLHIFDMPFGILMTGIGCISLAGVVVNNGIVLIDYINQLRDRGLPLEEAIIEGGVTRFRPVMLTAITTVLGLIPMAAGVSWDFFESEWVTASETSAFWGPMAIAVIFGLTFATILTLVVVPCLYSMVASFSLPWGRSSAPSVPSAVEQPQTST